MRSLGKSDLAAIAVGGILGATARWAVMRTAAADGWLTNAPDGSAAALFDRGVLVEASGIPVDTLIVNLAGCLLLGAFTRLLVHSIATSRRLLVAAAVGFCGSLTTFSTFAVEMAARLRASPVLSNDFSIATRQGAPADTTSIAIYLVASLLGGALAFWLGRLLAGTRANGSTT